MNPIKNKTLDANLFDDNKQIFPCKQRGKTPLTANGYKDATNNQETIAQWVAQYPNCNWAIATGTKSGVFVLDVDIDHNNGKYGDISLEELEKTHGKLPETATVLTGGGGKHLYFAMPEGVEIPCSAGKLGQGLDIRSDGGYVIIDGSIHESGRKYEWESDFDPYEDGMLFAQAPQWLINLVKRDERAVMKLSPATGLYYQSSEWDGMGEIARNDLLNALKYCENENRDDWLAVGMALNSVDSGEVGFELWENWSKTSAKYDPKDQARVWVSFNNSKSEKKQKETIFFIARKNGWVSVEKVERLIELNAQEEEIIADLNDTSVYDPKDAPKDDPINFEFPAEVPLLNQLRGILKASASCYSEAGTTQAVIALASLIASRRYLTPNGSPCQLYVGVTTALDGSTSEFRHAARFISELMRECGLHNMIRNSRITSTQQLNKLLYFSPASLYVCNDYSAMIKLAGRQTSAGGMDVVLNNITDLFDANFVQLDSCHDMGVSKHDLGNGDKDANDRPRIERPALSMLSLMHYNHLSTFAKCSEMSRGSVEQFLLAICESDDYVCQDEKPIDLRSEVIDGLYSVRGFTKHDGKPLEKTLENIYNELAGLTPHLITVRFDGDISVYDAKIDKVINMNPRKNRRFRDAARKNMRRLMTILAAFHSPTSPTATIQIMEWCANYVVGNLKRVINVLDVVASDDGKMDIAQKLVAAILNQGSDGIAMGNLVNICRGYKALPTDKRQEILDRLAEDGEILLNVKVKQKSGQVTKRVVHSIYIAKPSTD